MEDYTLENVNDHMRYMAQERDAAIRAIRSSDKPKEEQNRLILREVEDYHQEHIALRVDLSYRDYDATESQRYDPISRVSSALHEAERDSSQIEVQGDKIISLLEEYDVSKASSTERSMQVLTEIMLSNGLTSEDLHSKAFAAYIAEKNTKVHKEEMARAESLRKNSKGYESAKKQYDQDIHEIDDEVEKAHSLATSLSEMKGTKARENSNVVNQQIINNGSTLRLTE